jgi:hypothetical protein
MASKPSPVNKRCIFISNYYGFPLGEIVLF